MCSSTSTAVRPPPSEPAATRQPRSRSGVMSRARTTSAGGGVGSDRRLQPHPASRRAEVQPLVQVLPAEGVLSVVEKLALQGVGQRAAAQAERRVRIGPRLLVEQVGVELGGPLQPAEPRPVIVRRGAASSV